MYCLCKHLPQESFFVITAANKFGQHSCDDLEAYDESFSLPCQTFRMPVRKNEFMERIKFFIFATLKGIQLWTKKEYNCIIAVYPDESDLFVGYILSKLSRKPLVLYMHDLYSEVRESSHSRFARFFSWVEAKMFSASSAIIVTNITFRDYYYRRGIRNVLILNSCVELSKRDLVTSTSFKNLPKTKLRIVFTGSVSATNEDAVKCFLSTTKEHGRRNNF